MAELPDPTADLDWSGYVGSIQEHFSENAKKYPERLCVVETESSTSDKRSFTYKQIYEASNMLAHHLHDAGVTNGDVVMIWAHRSVDLVVGIMGTLASAATMSILDPAYPPARQKVYLEVAQPRALVNLAKATDEAGALAPIVRQYIDEQLQLKTEVPSLRINDEGFLSANATGKDLFAPVRAKAASPPATLVGPDSSPTLSFTSGSEGRPKGVLGRHFSLAKYFGWMAETFHLSSESRFTLLSGIAHDPVQRDIFTPLYLGAQLLVPSKEDIQHEKLAEWMLNHSPTTTHLTPAMNQILVGGATTSFPSLRSAFLVGDVLSKRDCRSLRSLAINVNIVNMYGTTETQRAVSYYSIPSQAQDPGYLENLKDIIPAGKGMQGVQLLVVNREDKHKLCGVGEVGEIYVRAAGLAEGYKGDQELNDQKFLQNWFANSETWLEIDRKIHRNEPWRKYYKGPRDRLYRTGDLGRYIDSTGVVECTGRADDQVKIRGFRIELNEIDSNLSQNSLIRDCKTLVRRDKDEEPKLVSYVVVEIAHWLQFLKERALEDVDDEGTEYGPTKVYSKRFTRMQAEVRDHLKDRLAEYAIPTRFIFLSKLPLNPNGKVDKPNLPFPDIAEQTEEASNDDLKRWDSLTQTERLVATKWANLIPGLNKQTIEPRRSFFDLGGHSILAQQMLLDIRRQTGADVTINVLYAGPRLDEFSAELDKHLGLASGTVNGDMETQFKPPAYAQSLARLLQQLPRTFQTADPATIRCSAKPTVFLTGATGFLGAYIMKDILERVDFGIRLIVHVRNVKDVQAARDRLRWSAERYLTWQDDWSACIQPVIGDLSKPQLGVDQQTWQKLTEEVDVVIHNGATVHWVKPYADLEASNVLSTTDCLSLCNEGKPKLFLFVSSTSSLPATNAQMVYETDELPGSHTGLSTGYGQTKWVSEQLSIAAGRRGLQGTIVRPGYVLGDPKTGVCVLDDFLIRLLKGSVQLAARPRISNTINATPVNRVARVVVAAALNPLCGGISVAHVDGQPRLQMREYLHTLEVHGFRAPEIQYEAWRDKLEGYVTAGAQEKDLEQHALMPLYHFCINDLPATTRAPDLDDSNTKKILKADADNWAGSNKGNGGGISCEDVSMYLGYLVAIGYISRPSGKGKPLPKIDLTASQLKADGAVGSRGGVSR